MGGEMFETVVIAATAEEAFNIARENAFYDHGHSGYTGTIAEKGEFVTFPKPEGLEAEDFIYGTQRPGYDELYHVVNDKWGPCAHFDLGDDHHVFFGLASC